MVTDIIVLKNLWGWKKSKQCHKYKMHTTYNLYYNIDITIIYIYTLKMYKHGAAHYTTHLCFNYFNCITFIYVVIHS